MGNFYQLRDRTDLSLRHHRFCVCFQAMRPRRLATNTRLTSQRRVNKKMAHWFTNGKCLWFTWKLKEVIWKNGTKLSKSLSAKISGGVRFNRLELRSWISPQSLSFFSQLRHYFFSKFRYGLMIFFQYLMKNSTSMSLGPMTIWDLGWRPTWPSRQSAFLRVEFCWAFHCVLTQRHSGQDKWGKKESWGHTL